MERDQLIGMAAASLSDLMKHRPEYRAKARQDIQIFERIIGEHEAEMEKIKRVFLAILRDIKQDTDRGEQPGETVTAGNNSGGQCYDCQTSRAAYSDGRESLKMASCPFRF